MGADAPGPPDWGDEHPISPLTPSSDQPFAPLTEEFDVGELDLSDGETDGDQQPPFCGLFAADSVWCGDFFSDGGVVTQ